REWALAAISDSSATTSCFWVRLRAIALLLFERRLRLAPLAVPGGGLSRNLPEGGTIYAGRALRPRLSGPACWGDDSMPCRASVPVAFARSPRLRSLTAVACLLEHRRRPQNFVFPALRAIAASAAPTTARLLQCQGGLIDRDAGAHGRADRDLLQVLALGR